MAGWRASRWLVGSFLAASAWSAEGSTIYDSTYGDNGLPHGAIMAFLTSNPNQSEGDDLTLDRSIPASERVVRAVNFGYGVPRNTAVPDCDAIIKFYDTEDPNAAGSALALTDPIGTVRLHIGSFGSLPNDRSLTSGYFDIQQQTAGGVLMPDGVSIWFVAAGTDLILPGPTITPMLSLGAVGVGSNRSNSYYHDGIDGTLVDGAFTGDERIVFVQGTIGKFWLQLDNAPEPSTLMLAMTALVVLSHHRRTGRLGYGEGKIGRN